MGPFTFTVTPYQWVEYLEETKRRDDRRRLRYLQKQRKELDIEMRFLERADLDAQKKVLAREEHKAQMQAARERS